LEKKDDKYYTDEVVKYFCFLQVDKSDEYQVSFLDWVDFLPLLKEDRLDPTVKMIVLPPFEMCSDLFDLDVKNHILRWANGDPRRTYYPKFFSSNEEGERSYYEHLIDLELEGCKPIPCIRVKADIHEDDFRNQLLNFKQLVQSNGIFVQRTFSSECKDIKLFYEDEVNNNLNSILTWMRCHSTQKQNGFMIEKAIEDMIEYRVFIVNGKATHCINDLYDHTADIIGHATYENTVSPGEESEKFLQRLYATAEKVAEFLTKVKGYEHFGFFCRVDLFYHKKTDTFYVNEAQGILSVSMFTYTLKNEEEEDIWLRKVSNAFEGYIKYSKNYLHEDIV